MSSFEAYAVTCVCKTCGHTEVIHPTCILDGHGFYSSDIDFCTKCGVMWKPEEANDGKNK